MNTERKRRVDVIPGRGLSHKDDLKLRISVRGAKLGDPGCDGVDDRLNSTNTRRENWRVEEQSHFGPVSARRVDANTHRIQFASCLQGFRGLRITLNERTQF